MHILLLQVELYLPECHSLKDKRHVIKPLLNELRRDFNISAAETDHHDEWQHAQIAVVAVGNLREALERTDREVLTLLETHASAQVSQVHREWL